MKIEAMQRIMASQKLHADEAGDKEYEQHLNQRIKNLNEDISDMSSEGEDASKEREQLKNAKEELTTLQKKMRGEPVPKKTK
jgi:lipid II:glycine glycyltransferase (peptidoglycan interpeptide bridge formation enzyme)